ACQHMTMNRAVVELLGIGDPDMDVAKTGHNAANLPFKILRDGVEVPGTDLPMERAARTGEPVIGETLEIRRADGTTRWEYVHAIPLFDQEGRTRGSLGTLVDMTGRKIMEDSLKTADRQKDEFLATLAHELRNPL